MGVYCNDDVSLSPPVHTFSSSSSSPRDLRLSKHVHDNVHANIYLNPLSLKFIDKEQFQSINFFKDYESDEKFTMPDDPISHLLPTSYQDMIGRVYAKRPELVESISDAFENFQLKTYGVKAQVHGTPEKQKRRICGNPS